VLPFPGNDETHRVRQSLACPGGRHNHGGRNQHPVEGDGFFDVGDTNGLRDLLVRCERDLPFYRRLQEQVDLRARLFTPEKERQAWANLLAEIELH